jgi:cysteine desulfurase
MAIQGVAAMHEGRVGHIVTQATEHLAVLDPCRYMAEQGHRVTVLPVDAHGRIRLSDLEAAIGDDTIVVTVMAANNEIGTIQPIGEIGALCKARGVLFHTDATQAIGRIPIDVEAMGIDLLSISAHKMHGPKGAGALYMRSRSPRVRCTPLFHGGGHEQGLRSGTLNVPGVVGLGAAAAIAQAEMEAESRRIRGLRDRLWAGLSERLDAVVWNGDRGNGLSNTLNVTIHGVDGESLMMSCKDIALASGSACTSASLDPSHVLKALGIPDELGPSSVRFSLGRFNTQAEIDTTIEQVSVAVNRLRAMSPRYEQASG